MPNHFSSLHVLRGIACVMVLLAHVGIWEHAIGPNRPWLGWVEWVGYGAVDCFFVLSGFVITYSQFHKRGRPGCVSQYFRARLLRVYPLYWLILPLGIVQVKLISGEPSGLAPSEPIGRWVSWLILAPHAQINHYLPSTWTLAYEISFYLIFGLLLLVTRPWAITGLLAWGVVAVLGEEQGWAGLHPVLGVVGSAHVWEILLGCGLAGLTRAGFRFPGSPLLVASLVWVGFWLVVRNPQTIPSFLVLDPWGRVGTFGIGAGLLVLGLIAWEGRNEVRMPKLLTLLGDASYSIYLGHLPACSAFFFLTLPTWPHSPVGHGLWVVAMILAGLSGGLVLHVLFERPLMAWIARGRSHRVEATDSHAEQNTHDLEMSSSRCSSLSHR
jgi:peptidoglycan/LPS O-acetylase OafA/YrhL